MKAVISALLLVGAAGEGADPIGQVIAMCEDLSAKVAAEGEAQQKAYEEYFEWCDDTAKEKSNELTTANAQKEKLEASIQEFESEIENCATNIEDLAKAISDNSKDLDAATKIRNEESSAFAKNEGELEDVVATLGKAITVLEKEMAAGSAAFAQVSNSASMSEMMKSLNLIIDASSIGQSDKQKLVALVQSKEDSEDDDSEDAPSAANYEKKSGSIVDVLVDMKDKAETQLADLRKAERTSKQNYGKLKQTLTDNLANDNADMAFQKKKKAGSEEAKATAEGELEVTVKDIKTTEEALALTQKDCMQVATDHEAAVQSMNEELKVIAMAIKIIKEATFVQTSATSFVQTKMETAMQSVSSQVTKTLRRLAKEQHSGALAQLASRIAMLQRSGAFRSTDPFVKVRGMISDMISKLEKSMGAEAAEKAYCDEEMGKTEEKKTKLETTVEKLTNKIDKSASKSAELKEQVKTLQEELATMAKEQEEMDKVRADEHKVYLEEKAVLVKGLAGLRKALELLRDYYGSASAAALVQEDAGEDADDAQPAAPAGHSKSGGAGGSIISILEVAEEDMAKELTKVETQEADEQAAYDETTQENKVTKAAKDQDVKYKSQEAASLDKSITELTGDRDTTSEELTTVNMYFMKIQERCVAKPVSYEERKKAREAEIKGLKEALSILESEAALVQTGSKKAGNMRGALQL
jgi:chromosome segregation ATPase